MPKSISTDVILSSISTEAGRALLLQHCGDLPVSTHKKVGDLKKHAFRMSNAPIETVFLCLAQYQPEHRANSNWQSTPALVIEFDDLPKPQSDAELQQRAREDTVRAASVMSNLIRNEEVISVPNLVVYSGNKSFHCYFFLLPHLCNSDDIQTIRRSASIYQERAKQTPEGTHLAGCKSAVKMDMSVFASRTGIARIPSDFVGLGRLPQRCWITENPNPLDTNALISSSKIRCDEADAEKSRPKTISRCHILKRQRSRNFESQFFSINETESILGKLQVSSDGSRWSCKCPVHDDKHPSAVTNQKGFIHCSACCTPSKTWVARLQRNAHGTIEVVANEK